MLYFSLTELIVGKTSVILDILIPTGQDSSQGVHPKHASKTLSFVNNLFILPNAEKIMLFVVLYDKQLSKH
ncbi:hypothetical protein DJ528_10485, partial [Sulfolobus sp. B5]